MVNPIHPSDRAEALSGQQNPKENQRLLEIQFETAVLGVFVSVSGQDGSLQNQLSQLKNGVQSGQPSSQLATSVNQLISQINGMIVPGKAKFPSFQFTGEGSSAQALANYAISLEKALNAASENGNITWGDEQKIFSKLSQFVNQVGQLTPNQAINKLNGIIEEANTALLSQNTIPTLSLG